MSNECSAAKKEVCGHMEALACDCCDWEHIKIRFPTRLIEAEISEEVILSHEWLFSFKIEVLVWKHGLHAEIEGRKLWIPGEKRMLAIMYYRQGCKPG